MGCVLNPAFLSGDVGSVDQVPTEVRRVALDWFLLVERGFLIIFILVLEQFLAILFAGIGIWFSVEVELACGCIDLIVFRLEIRVGNWVNPLEPTQVIPLIHIPLLLGLDELLRFLPLMVYLPLPCKKSLLVVLL